MLRRSTCIKLLVLLALAAIAAPLLAYALLLPWIVRDQIESALHDAGFEQVRFDLSRANLWGIEVDGLAMDAWRIEHATIEYTPGSLWHSRVRSVRVRGAEIVIDRTANAATAPSTSPTTGPADEEEPLDLKLPLDRIDVTNSFVVIKSARTAVRIPVEAHLTVHTDQRYAIELTTALNDEPIVVAGTINPSGPSIEAKVDAPVAPAGAVVRILNALLPFAPLEADGEVQLTGTFKWSKDETTWHARIEPSDLWLSQPAGGEEGTNVGWYGGVLQVSGRAPSNAAATLILNMDQLELESESYDLEIEGLTGTLDLASLSPVATAPQQHLDIDRLRSGEMIFLDGSIDFQINEQSIIEIQRTQWRWLAGTVLAENAMIDPSTTSIDATVQATGVQLRKLLELFADEYARGEGRINATLPVQVRGWRIGFGEGSVVGVGGGSLQILDAEEVAESVVDSRDRNQQAMQEQVAEALSDFEYDILQARLTVEEDRGLMARMQLSGRAKTGARRAVNLQLNIDGLDQLLLYYLGIQRHLSQN